MKPIPVLGIPHYNRPDLLARCLASIDYPVDKLVVVQNGPDEQMLARRPGAPLWMAGNGHLVKEIVHIRHPNAGVAGAWNEVIKLFPAPYWMIVNNDIQFAAGDLEKMAAAADEGGQDVGIFYGNHGASFFIITEWGVETAGLFDENIYPAYLEDCDMSRRMDLLGVKRQNVGGVNAVHGDGVLTGSCTIHATPELREKNGRTHGENFVYYRAKWGGNNGEEKFSRPFNDENWPIDFWRYEPKRRAKQKLQF